MSLTVLELGAVQGVGLRRGEKLLQKEQRAASHDREGAV